LTIFLWIENSLKDLTIDVFNSSLGWRGHVDGKEVSLKSVWNIILTTTWMKHCTNELEILNGLEETSVILGQEVETFMLDQLTSDLQSDLITPCVYERHRNIINEDSHVLSTWWGESSNLLFLNLSLNGLLEVEWSSGTREIDSLEEHCLRVKFGAVHEAYGSLGSSWRSNKKSVEMSWLRSSSMSDNWKRSDLGHDVLSSGGLTSWNKQLRESNLLWSLP
jgi:hypothetical protein